MMILVCGIYTAARPPYYRLIEAFNLVHTWGRNFHSKLKCAENVAPLARPLVDKRVIVDEICVNLKNLDEISAFSKYGRLVGARIQQCV